jgi:hypothetical protein
MEAHSSTGQMPQKQKHVWKGYIIVVKLQFSCESLFDSAHFRFCFSAIMKSIINAVDLEHTPLLVESGVVLHQSSLG